LLESRSLEWLDQAKRQGPDPFRGVLLHDEYALFEEIVGAHDWDFCQIQYNYAQRDVQAGVRGLKYAAAKGLGVAIMEPLFGGVLTGPSCRQGESDFSRKRAGSRRVRASLALGPAAKRAVVLSGMSDRHQLAENLRTAGSAAAGSLTARERQVLDRVSDYLRDHVPIACGGCGYCLPHCPAA
jgi:predicted aldo/keto reductase-like oxidoreductase